MTHLSAIPPLVTPLLALPVLVVLAAHPLLAICFLATSQSLHVLQFIPAIILLRDMESTAWTELILAEF